MITARGVRVVAISMDSPEDSRAFAAKYDITFPLLADKDGAVSRQYTGVTSDDNTLPGVVIVRDSRIVFRQLADSKDDRLSTEQLLVELDRTLGTHGPGLSDTHYAAIDRVQLRADIGGATTFVSRASALLPVGHYLVLGPRISYERKFSVGGIAALRLPFLRDTAAIEIGATAQYAPFAARNTVGGIADLWFAWSPNWSLQLGVEVDNHDVAATFGIGRLLEF